MKKYSIAYNGLPNELIHLLIQLFDDVKIKIKRAFSKKMFFFIFIFLHVFLKNLNRERYENIAL